MDYICTEKINRIWLLLIEPLWLALFLYPYIYKANKINLKQMSDIYTEDITLLLAR